MKRFELNSLQWLRDVVVRWVRHWWSDLIIIAIYTSLVIAMTWPLVIYLDNRFAGQSTDVWINQWATWWTEKAMSEGKSLYYTDLMFYPSGVSLTFHSFSHVNTVLALLLRPWLGDLGAHNATVLLAHILSGYAVFCLVRYITRSRSTVAAFFAGLVFALLPYRMSESVHPVIVSTQWMPFYFLFLIRLVDEGNKRYVMPTAIFFVLTALSSWHLMIFTIFLSVVYLGYLTAVERWRCPGTTAPSLALLLGLICASLVPFIYPLVREQLTTSSPHVGAPLQYAEGNDIVAFFLPDRGHPIWGQLVERVYGDVPSSHPAYLGLTVIGLGMVASLTDWRRARFWILLALLSMLFSIGPDVQVGGHTFDVVVPWSKPVIWLLRHPFRFNLLIGFALAVTSGIGLSTVMHRLLANWSRWRWPFAGAMVALLIFEYLSFPFPTTDAFVPDYYHNLSSLPGEGAILELPMGRQPSKVYLYYQRIHNKPLVEGVVSRTPQDAYAFIRATPVLRSFWACGNNVLPPADLSSVLNALGEQGIEYVILHKHLVQSSSLDLWRSVRTTSPDYEDMYIAVYGTRVKPLGSAGGGAQLLDSCVAVRSVITSSITALPGEVLEIPVEWVAGNSPVEEHILELALADEAGEIKWSRRYEVMPDISLTDWDLGARHVVSYSFPIDPWLPQGLYHLQATLVPVEREREVLLSAHLLDIQVLTRCSSLMRGD